MKKNISRKQVIDTVLELLQNNSDIDKLNFREIARKLGCAHTNLYNYFSTYSDLLWESHSAILNNFMNTLKEQMNNASPSELRVVSFFKIIVNMYMDNKGWFRLSWHEYIKGERSEKDIETAKTANGILNGYAMDICKELFKECPDKNSVKQVLHNTHCYIIGEISNYLLGRSFMDSEAELRAYIVNEAVTMFKLCLIGKQQNGAKI